MPNSAPLGLVRSLRFEAFAKQRLLASQTALNFACSKFIIFENRASIRKFAPFENFPLCSMSNQLWRRFNLKNVLTSNHYISQVGIFTYSRGSHCHSNNETNPYHDIVLLVEQVLHHCMKAVLIMLRVFGTLFQHLPMSVFLMIYWSTLVLKEGTLNEQPSFTIVLFFSRNLAISPSAPAPPAKYYIRNNEMWSWSPFSHNTIDRERIFPYQGCSPPQFTLPSEHLHVHDLCVCTHSRKEQVTKNRLVWQVVLHYVNTV